MKHSKSNDDESEQIIIQYMPRGEVQPSKISEINHLCDEILKKYSLETFCIVIANNMINYIYVLTTGIIDVFGQSS